MSDRYHSPRNRHFGIPPHKRSSAFVWSRKGKILYAVGPFAPSASDAAVQGLYDDLADQFGYGVARVVCNAICFPPYRMPPLYSVGTRARLNRLYQVIDAHGRFVAGEGFAGAGDDLADIDDLIDDQDCGFVASDLPPLADPVERLKASADLPLHYLIGTSDIAICLPSYGGYDMFRFCDGRWHVIHTDMPAIILKAKCQVVYPDLCTGILGAVSALPELDKLTGKADRELLRLAVRAEQ